MRKGESIIDWLDRLNDAGRNVPLKAKPYKIKLLDLHGYTDYAEDDYIEDDDEEEQIYLYPSENHIYPVFLVRKGAPWKEEEDEDDDGDYAFLLEEGGSKYGHYTPPVWADTDTDLIDAYPPACIEEIYNFITVNDPADVLTRAIENYAKDLERKVHEKELLYHAGLECPLCGYGDDISDTVKYVEKWVMDRVGNDRKEYIKVWLFGGLEFAAKERDEILENLRSGYTPEEEEHIKSCHKRYDEFMMDAEAFIIRVHHNYSDNCHAWVAKYTREGGIAVMVVEKPVKYPYVDSIELTNILIKARSNPGLYSHKDLSKDWTPKIVSVIDPRKPRRRKTRSK